MLSKPPRHEDVLGSGGIAPRILDLSTKMEVTVVCLNFVHVFLFQYVDIQGAVLGI